MLELVIILAAYSVLILVFVPLEKIGKAQTSVKKKVAQIKKSIED
jgi:competence protein ComGC